jgi:hypothetical protein
MRTSLAFAAIGTGIYFAPLDWELLLAIFFFGTFSVVTFLAFWYRDPHRHLDTEKNDDGKAC